MTATFIEEKRRKRSIALALQHSGVVLLTPDRPGRIWISSRSPASSSHSTLGARKKRLSFLFFGSTHASHDGIRARILHVAFLKLGTADPFFHFLILAESLRQVRDQ